MQGYRVREEVINYQAGESNCELIFYRCTEPHKKYHVYDLEILINGLSDHELYDQWLENQQKKLELSFLKSLIRETIKALDDWCLRHPNTFISFFECLNPISRLSYKLGFISDGRCDTFVAFVDSEGKRTAYVGMLNLLEEDDFWVNDLWRVAKDYHFYLGDIYTPVDFIGELLTKAEILHIKTSYKKPDFFD